MAVSSSPLLLPNRFTLKPPNPRPIPVLFRRRTEVFVASMTGNRNPRPLVWNRVVVADKEKEQQCSSISTTIDLARNLVFRRSPEGALLFLLFVISTALGSFLSLAIISLPTMDAFRKLSLSMDKLSKVISEEVPGTLSSLKLSGLEINDLTSELSNLRQRILGNQYTKRERMSKPRIDGNDPIIN